MKSLIRRLLAEPLCQFVILGAILFAGYSLVSNQVGGNAGAIIVTQGKIENLAATFAATRQRSPTQEELIGLIQDYIREEVLYREAMALGLDRDDTIIRRRLRQKMEFLSADTSAQAEPTEEEMQAYLAAHPETFRVEPRFTFRHVYLDPQRRPATLSRDIERTLTELRKDGSKAKIATQGDSLLLEQEFDNAPALEVQKTFGQEFFEHLTKLTPGAWDGPVRSGYGVHLVFLIERTDGYVPALAEVREQVRREWTHARRADASETFYQQLLKRYSVMVEEPQRLAAVANSKIQSPDTSK